MTNTYMCAFEINIIKKDYTLAVYSYRCSVHNHDIQLSMLWSTIFYYVLSKQYWNHHIPNMAPPSDECVSAGR